MAGIKPLRILPGILLLCHAVVAQANLLLLQPDAEIRDGHPQTYEVAPGDTLWNVAEKFLRDPWNAAAEWAKNPPKVYAGDQVSLVRHGNQYGLQIKHRREVKLSPGVRVPRDKPAIEIIPYGAIQQFLSHPGVMTAGELEGTPYIVASLDERLLLGNGNTIYVKGLEGFSRVSRYRIVRQGQAYENKEGEVLAHEMEYLGEAEIVESGEPATLTIINAQRSIRVGDHLLPIENRSFERNFQPREPDYLDGGHIIAVIDGVSQIGQYQIVVVDRGEVGGLEVGHVLGVYRGGERVKDPTRPEIWHGEAIMLPSEKIGEVLVFRVFDRIAYGLIMTATRAINLYDPVGLP